MARRGAHVDATSRVRLGDPDDGVVGEAHPKLCSLASMRRVVGSALTNVQRAFAGKEVLHLA
jgi:hypothetical protein